MSTQERTVYVVDDDEGVREALAMLFGTAGLNVEMFASAAQFLEARPKCTPPCCLVLDIRMPGPTGLALQEALVQRGIRVPTVFITGHGDIPMAVEAVKKGALDFLEKPFEHHRLLCGVLDALDGEASRRQDSITREARTARIAALTEREREVLGRILDGKPNRVVAQELFITLKTVEFHRARIMGKLGVKNAAELFRFCLEAEALPPSH